MEIDRQRANKALMAKAARGFAEGDLKPLLTALDEKVEWVSNSPLQFFRFGGKHAKLAGVTELQALMAATYLFHRFDPKEIIAEGDTVWGLFDVEATHQPSGKKVRTDLAIRWVVRNGKVISHQGFFDTAGMLAQQGQLPPIQKT